MNILISNTSDKPLYQQIKEQIKDAILRAELSEGELMPSIRSFANDIHVSVLTIRRVYDELEADGFVTSQAGKGTFVSAGNLELLMDSKRRLVEEKLQEAIQNAKLFNISKKELLAMMEILYEEDETV
nr:GntR family transcriptional regulator [uncultured Aminipila sp.]